MRKSSLFDALNMVLNRSFIATRRNVVAVQTVHVIAFFDGVLSGKECVRHDD
jgi:hypothetical protein